MIHNNIHFSWTFCMTGGVCVCLYNRLSMCVFYRIFRLSRLIHLIAQHFCEMASLRSKIEFELSFLSFAFNLNRLYKKQMLSITIKGGCRNLMHFRWKLLLPSYAYSGELKVHQKLWKYSTGWEKSVKGTCFVWLTDCSHLSQGFVNCYCL